MSQSSSDADVAHVLAPCGMVPPSNLSELASERLVGISSGVGGTARESQTREKLQAFLMSPNLTAEDWESRIWRNQRSCSGRFLLIEDDLDEAGLGFTAGVLAAALLVAAHQGRVLIEVPVDRSWRHATWNHSGAWHERRRALEPGLQPRWCDRPPYTLRCFYRELTHCGHPSQAALKSAIRYWERFDRGLAPYRAQMAFLRSEFVRQSVVRFKLSFFPPALRMMSKVSDVARGAAFRFLFRPREWVLRMGECLTAWGQLRSRTVAVHVRDSPEKIKEVRERNKQGLPNLHAYAATAATLSASLFQKDATNVTAMPRRPMFVQTASPTALRGLVRLLERDPAARVVATNNSRAEHDTWGGWRHGHEMHDGTVAAVNLLLASQAAVFVSPKLSAWTKLVQHMSGSHPKEVVGVCCSTTPQSAAGCSRANLHVSAPHRSLPEIRAALATLPRGCQARGS